MEHAICQKLGKSSPYATEPHQQRYIIVDGLTLTKLNGSSSALQYVQHNATFARVHTPPPPVPQFRSKKN
ncbi:unnamed protein product [Caenorhabditis brenneri]